MKAILLAAMAAFALVGCATPKPSDEDHAAHHPPGAATGRAARVDQQMKTMQEMHQKMMAAKTPEQRQALMGEHMKAMQGGMSMMCEMGGSTDLQGGAGSSDMMKRCMEMRDMTMQMMMGREPGNTPPAK